MKDGDKYTYIIMFAGIYFIIFPSLFLTLLIGANKNIPIYFEVFSYFFILIHLFIGISIIIRKKFGFILLKYYLKYFLKLGYPIGTIIANNMLEYIKENNIEDYFNYNLNRNRKD